MDLKQSLGYEPKKNNQVAESDKLIRYINLKLSALGYPVFKNDADAEFFEIADPHLRNHRQKNKLLSNYLCPVDQRIQQFLNEFLRDVCPTGAPRIPVNVLILDRHGIARMLSLPPDQDYFSSNIVNSYRVKQGVLHNPHNDRRTTQGVFHICEEGLPIPDDKIAVPKSVFAKMLEKAFQPPKELLQLPFTCTQKNQAQLFASLLLRPLVSPDVPGYLAQKSMEIRFFAPGNLVSNLDFVESIFGNGGDPYLPENDAALDVEHWTGHTGCVILAPHLVNLKKKDLGLPSYKQATDRQRRDGMCWKTEDELYNHGQAFKLTCRDEKGVIVTLIADNYFGYCKKEVKTQISYSANLYGLCEEEHSGGALTFPAYDLGEEFHRDEAVIRDTSSFEDIRKLYGNLMEVKSEGYGVDKQYPQIIYVPENAKFSLPQQSIRWNHQGQEQKIKLLAGHYYVFPSGYKVFIKKQTGGQNWHLIGVVAEGTLCHKPCTVSGGGKSEISKTIVDTMIQGPIFTSNFHKDITLVKKILDRNFGDRFLKRFEKAGPSRPVLSPNRSLGSVIKLFTPSSEYTAKYNVWLDSIPQHIKDMIFVVKRYYKQEWGSDWEKNFGVDIINGHLGHELKLGTRKLIGNYLRIGHQEDGSWRIYKVRPDFASADKLQVEDDITASVVVPAEKLSHLNPEYSNPSVKMVTNCEYRLFQRPDDAIYRGFDKQAEADLAAPGNFLSNYEPLTLERAKDIIEDAISFDKFTEPMKQLFLGFAEDRKPDYIVSSAHPRVINGKPSKNPRYLQNRPDLVQPHRYYLAHIGARFARKVPLNQPVHFPINAVLPGRRNNPPDLQSGTPPLAVYNPIHYQELPELFMDFIASLTGKSPSTTGFGSEGALTKGPFNALPPIIDLNNALISYIVTGYNGFSSAAGHIGPHIRIDHDISLLIPEIWSRMSVAEREPDYLIKHGFFEKLNDFDYHGRKIFASRLGYRITIRFANTFLGRIFNNPNVVFSEEMLKPEKQGLDVFVEGIENIVSTQKRVAEHYFNDASIHLACPPLRALLHIMAYGHYEGKDSNHPEIRGMFTRDYVLESDWYQERLYTKQRRDIALWTRHIESLKKFIHFPQHAESVDQLHLHDRLRKAEEMLRYVQSSQYLQELKGTLGANPLTSDTLSSPISELAHVKSDTY